MYALQGSKNRATATTILSTETPLPTPHTGLQLAKCGHQPSPFTTARPCQIPWAMKTTAMSASHTHDGGFFHISVSNQQMSANELRAAIDLGRKQYRPKLLK